MKQLLFMMVLTFIGTGGVLVAPICGVAVYYLFAVLRPQYIWVWSLPPGVAWSMFVAVGTMVGAALYLLRVVPGAVPPEERPRPFGAAHAALLLFALWVSLSYVNAQNQEEAWPWFLEYMKIFVMFFVSALLIQTVRHVWILMMVAALALGYIAYEINFDYFVHRSMRIYFNGYGGLDNNGAGLMLAMGIPLCLYLYLGTTQWWRWIFAAFIPVMLHAVLLTFSRGAMVALLAATPLIFLRSRHKAQLLLAAAAIALVLPWLAGPSVREEFFSVREYQEDGSAQSRFDSWRAAVRIAGDYPLFGVGVRNSVLFSYDYGADMEGRAIHSQLLQILADNGYPGLLLYLLLLLLAALSLRKVRRWARHESTDDARRAYAAACGLEASLAVFVAGGLFLSLEVVELPYLLLLLGAQLPLVLRLEAQARQREVPADVVPTRVNLAHVLRETRCG